MRSCLRIIVTGLIAQHPNLGGVTWDYLQYLLGLQKLGHDVYYFEDSGQWPYKLYGGPSGNDWVTYDPSANIDYLKKVMSRYGMTDKWAYHFPTKAQWFGLSEPERKELIKTADLLINVSGSLEHPENYQKVNRLIYIDSDPAFTQLKIICGEPEFREQVNIHDAHFTFGECLSNAALTTGHNWLPTRQPIFLGEWDNAKPYRNVYTTVMNWTSYETITHNGINYGQKDIEFYQFIDLPSIIAPAVLEVALRTQKVNWNSSQSTLPQTVSKISQQHREITCGQLLEHTGWRIADATKRCSNLDKYRRYIESSKAEWSVAKNGYVVAQTGWFSCRSACYLAAGKPVVVQDTGFGAIIPVGAGILSFTTMDDAIYAIQQVDTNYLFHSKAARSIAEEYFDSDKVLRSLIDRGMNSDV
jgi:hypothetical protein